MAIRFFLIGFLVLQLTFAQAPSPVAAKVRDLPIGGKLTVLMPDGSEYYGNLKSIDPDSFTIREVDLKREVTLRYVDVKNVLKGYGGRGFGGRRVYPRRNLIAGLAIVGGLLVLVFVAVAADKS